MGTLGPKPIALAIIARGGKFLVAKRADDRPLGGLWEFPGGKIEPGESPEEAAVRECREEMGCEVRAIRRLGSIHHRYPTFSVELHALLCDLGDDQTPQVLDETAITAIAWHSLRELQSTPIPDANHALLKMLSAADLT